MRKFQNSVVDWIVSTFGLTIARDQVERNHRFLEEALELVQSAGCTKDEALMLVDYVFARPVGEPFQEVGGTIITLCGLCAAHDVDLEDAAWTELDSAWERQDKIRQKQLTKPKSGPLPQ